MCSGREDPTSKRGGESDAPTAERNAPLVWILRLDARDLLSGHLALYVSAPRNWARQCGGGRKRVGTGSRVPWAPWAPWAPAPPGWMERCLLKLRSREGGDCALWAFSDDGRAEWLGWGWSGDAWGRGGFGFCTVNGIAIQCHAVYLPIRKYYIVWFRLSQCRPQGYRSLAIYPISLRE